MHDAEVQRIRRDLEHAQQRVAEIRAGKRGVRPPSDWRADTKVSVPADRLAYERQLQAQEQAVGRLQLEYANAMLPVWGAARVIEKMEALVAPQAARPPSDADVTLKLSEVLAHIPDNTPVGDIKRTLLQ